MPQTVAACLVAVITILTAADLVLPGLQVSPLLYRLMVLTFIALLPVVIALSWFYDITRSGIIRTMSRDDFLSQSGPSGNHPAGRASRSAASPNWAVAKSGSIESVAILPFTNISRDVEGEYLSDGITETIINKLAMLGGVDLRVASCWDDPRIYSTTKKSRIPGCWGDLPKPGAVQIATRGTWWEKRGHQVENLGLTGGPGANYNHAKFGVSTSGRKPFSIFGDLYQQGALRPGYNKPEQPCSSSQNGRGGMFYVMEDQVLHKSLSSLLEGDSAPSRQPPKRGK